MAAGAGSLPPLVAHLAGMVELDTGQIGVRPVGVRAQSLADDVVAGIAVVGDRRSIRREHLPVVAAEAALTRTMARVVEMRLEVRPHLWEEAGDDGTVRSGDRSFFGPQLFIARYVRVASSTVEKQPAGHDCERGKGGEEGPQRDGPVPTSSLASFPATSADEPSLG